MHYLINNLIVKRIYRPPAFLKISLISPLKMTSNYQSDSIDNLTATFSRLLMAMHGNNRVIQFLRAFASMFLSFPCSCILHFNDIQNCRNSEQLIRAYACFRERLCGFGHGYNTYAPLSIFCRSATRNWMHTR